MFICTSNKLPFLFLFQTYKFLTIFIRTYLQMALSGPVCAWILLSHAGKTLTSFDLRNLTRAGGWSVLQMSPSNEDASVAQWYGLGTPNPRTCFISLTWQRAKPRTLRWTFLPTWFILFFLSWQRAKPRTLNRRNRSTVPVHLIA